MSVSDALRRLVRERAASRCEYCHADEHWQFIRFTIDHVVPRSLAGADEPENLALACRNCNERRQNRTHGTDPQTQSAVPLFNPRQDVWSEHFAWHADSLHLVGLTLSGRATVALLDMNDERHEGHVLRVRQRDIDDGYHPPPGDPLLDS